MILAYTLALLSIGLLIAIVICLVLLKQQNQGVRILLLLFSYKVVQEILMFSLSLGGIHNHILVNINVLIFGIGCMYIITLVWKRILKTTFPKWVFLLCISLFFIVWLAEGIFIHSFTKFNPFTQAFIFIIILFLVIYLLNALMFSMNSRIDARFDWYIIFALLTHCFGAIILDSFFNYYINLPANVYMIISDLGLIIGVITNILVLLAVICLMQNKKLFSL